MENVNLKKEVKIESVSDDFFYILKSLVYSIIGIIIFFIPIKVNGQVYTIIYHLSYKIQSNIRPMLEACIVFYTFIGCIKPIKKLKDKKLSINNIFLYIRLFSVSILINIFYGKNSMIFLEDNILLHINEVVLNIATMIPITAIFIPLILNYGLVDIVESYFQKSMKKLFNLSGKSIVNIFVYLFTDSYCGLYMTNKLYKEGKLRENEVFIILLNFSITSIPLIIYISKELSLNTFNLTIMSIIILVIVNIISSRIYPISKKKKSYHIKTQYKETIHKDNKLKKGMDKYIKNNDKRSLFKDIIKNFEESIKISMNLIPNIIIILYIGNIIINMDIIIEILKYLIYPLIDLLKIPYKNELSEFCINLFYNNIVAIDNLSKNIDYTSRFLVGIISILTYTSATTNIAYISNTAINIKKKEFIISYIQRIFMIICIYSIFYYFYKGYIM